MSGLLEGSVLDIKDGCFVHFSFKKPKKMPFVLDQLKPPPYLCLITGEKTFFN